MTGGPPARGFLTALALTCLVLTCLVLSGLGVPRDAASASSRPPLITGRLVDYPSGNPAAGLTVTLQRATARGPGAEVDRVLTSADGRFALRARTSEGRYYVRVIGGRRYAGGHVGTRQGTEPRAVERAIRDAETFGPHFALGTIRAIPVFVSGTVVDSRSGRGVRAVHVTVRSFSDPTAVKGAAETATDGGFDISGLRCAPGDCYLKLSGATVGWETGYLTCTYAVSQRRSQACIAPTGRIRTPISLDRH